MYGGMNPNAMNPAAALDVPGLVPPSGTGDPTRRLGDVAVDLGMADRELVERVMAEERETNRPVGALLVESGIIDADQLARILAERNSLPYVDLNSFEVDQGAANVIDAAEARRYGTIPIAFLDDGGLLVATADPSNVLGPDNIAMATGYEVKRAVATPDAISALITRLTGLSGSVTEIEEHSDGLDQGEVVELHASAKQAPVVKLVHSIIADAVNRGASDIHFDPRREAMQVRYRVDGVMIDSTTVPNNLVAGLVSRIKIMAELDIAERRVPQDGRVALEVDGRHIDIRVAVLPVIRGESVVMRILDKDRVVLDLDSLGMREQDQRLVLDAVGQIQGAILATGPTGTGKTTTLVRAAPRAQHARPDPDQHRGPGRVRGRRGQADPRQPGRRGHLRLGPALDGALRSRRADGRGDPRPGDRPGGDGGRPHRPPRPLDPAHEQRGDHRRPADRHGRRALPDRVGDPLHHRPAPRSPALRRMQASRRALERRAGRTRVR